MQIAVFDVKSYDREYLEKASEGTSIEWRFFEHRLTKDTVSSASGCIAVCAFVNDSCDREVLIQMHNAGVRVVALRCAGFNQIDLVAAKELGIQVVRVHAYSPNAVAEHTVALLLGINRKIHRSYNRVREFNFSLHGLVGFDVVGKTVGILGTGKIGRITAQIFRGFGANVIASDVYPEVEWAAENKIEYVDPNTLLKGSDILSLHVPLTPDTKYLLNEQTIALTKSGVTILNTSRGKLIDTTALIKSLKSGHVRAVGLDVYEEEEGIFFEDLSGEILADDELARLLTFPNVLITAHQAFLTHEALSEIARITVQNLLRYETQKPYLDGTQLT